MQITTDELNRCKRAVVVLAEAFKLANGGKQAPLALREDMLVLTKVLRRLEPLATPARRHRLPGCPTCDEKKTDYHPPHDASPRCESGKRNHCSCDTCF